MAATEPTAKEDAEKKLAALKAKHESVEREKDAELKTKEEKIKALEDQRYFLVRVIRKRMQVDKALLLLLNEDEEEEIEALGRIESLWTQLGRLAGSAILVMTSILLTICEKQLRFHECSSMTLGLVGIGRDWGTQFRRRCK